MSNEEDLTTEAPQRKKPGRKPRNRVDAAEVDMQQPSDIILPASGAHQVRSDTIETVADMTTVSEKKAALSFMEEPVEVMIHESTDPNAEPFVFCAVNGEGAGHNKMPWLPRGVPVTIKRKFVERLARAKPVGIQTRETRDADGARTTRVVRHQALKYPFSIITDPNPRGVSWLKQVLAQA